MSCRPTKQPLTLAPKKEKTHGGCWFGQFVKFKFKYYKLKNKKLLHQWNTNWLEKREGSFHSSS